MHELSIGIDYKHQPQSDLTLQSAVGSITLVVASAISYAPVSLAYSGSAVDDDGVTRWSLSLLENISGLVPGGGEEEFGGDPDTLFDGDLENDVPGNRVGATGTFFVIKGRGSRVQSLDQGFSLSMSLDGQVASEPLIPAEQYFAGGVESVRGLSLIHISEPTRH